MDMRCRNDFARAFLIAGVLALAGQGTAVAADAQLADAAERRQSDLVTTLLDQGVDVDAPQPDGATALHWAVSKGETPVSYAGTEAPGEWRAIPGVPDEEKRFALIDSLLAHGANIEATSSRSLPAWVPFEQRSRPGATPFYTAAAGGDAAVMRLLVAWGADPLARAMPETSQHRSWQSAATWGRSSPRSNTHSPSLKTIDSRRSSSRGSSATTSTPRTSRVIGRCITLPALDSTV